MSVTQAAAIERLWPNPSGELSDEDIIAGLRGGSPHADAPVLRVNFVSSVDGAATHEGRSGGLSGEADKRHFELLRRACDVVLVGAGTVRTEGYGAMRVSEESARWRADHGLPEHPVFAIVSGGLDLDPSSEIFTDAPAMPIVFTTSRGVERRERFEGRADVVVDRAGGGAGAADAVRVHGQTIVDALHERGLTSVLCEGGPRLFGALAEDDVVDELFLTLSPTLESGDGPRITAGELGTSVALELASVLSSGSTLLLRYRVA